MGQIGPMRQSRQKVVGRQRATPTAGTEVKARRAAVHTLCNQDDRLRELVLHKVNGNVHAVLGYSVPLRDGSVALTKGFVLTITVTTIGDNLESVHSTRWLN